jgi:hypothetical protein
VITVGLNHNSYSSDQQGDGITVTGDPQAIPFESGGARTIRRATEPSLASVREFLLLQDEAHQRSRSQTFFGFDPLDRGAAEAYSGAVAEVTVSDALAALGDEWTVVDTVAIGSHEPLVDHLVVGPPGVFSIGLRNHADEQVWVGERTFLVGGSRLPHLRDAEHEADLVAERMSAAVGFPVTVTPCLVVAARDALTVHSVGRRAQVILPGELACWLASLPRLLSPAAVEARRAIVIEPSNWAEDARQPRPDNQRHRAEFDRIHAQIISAHRRRLGWVISGAILSQLALAGLVLEVRYGLF